MVSYSDSEIVLSGRISMTKLEPKQMDKGLLKYATKTEEKYLLAVNKHGGIRAAAKKLKRNHSTVSRAMTTLEERAAEKGYAPLQGLDFEIPPGFAIKKMSTLTNARGEVVLNWLKMSREEKAYYEAVKDSLGAFLEEVKGTSPIFKPKPGKWIGNKLTLYPIPDAHTGLYAWKPETGNDWDLSIAEETYINAALRMVALAPKTRKCILANLGDFFHVDNLDNTTSRSKNPLDVDSRLAKVFRVGVRILRTFIDAALEKHETVEVINSIGNHDDVAAIYLGLLLEYFYENNPRVIVEKDPAKFHYRKFGKCMWGFTHGDTSKPADLPGLMADDASEMWGKTKHRRFFTGHIHKQTVHNFPGCMVESLSTLTARDFYSASHPFRSERKMVCMVYHKEYGEEERFTIDISQIEKKTKD